MSTAHATLNAETYGTGDLVIAYLHGWSGDHSSVEPLLNYFPDHVRVVAFDMPGVGDSPDPDEWSAEHVASTVLAALQSIEANQLVIVGNCSGANLLLPILPKLGGLADHLVMIDPFAYTPWYFRLLLSWPFGAFFYWFAFLTPVGRWLTNTSLKERRTEESHLTESFERVHPWNTYRYLRLLSSLGHGSEYPENPVPTTILTGEKTFKAIRESVDIWSEMWPQSTIRVLRNAGHLPILEATEQVSGAVLEAINWTPVKRVSGNQHSPD
jgi:pimeloyl-ACP methyl ester carboxylesterase